MQLKSGGKFHLKLNIGGRPIANKYREGKMKSTLERELTAREIVERETLEVSCVPWVSTLGAGQRRFLEGGQGLEECGTPGCVIASCLIPPLRSRTAVRPLGTSFGLFAPRMLVEWL
jgi:hypothetical protein